MQGACIARCRSLHQLPPAEDRPHVHHPADQRLVFSRHEDHAIGRSTPRGAACARRGSTYDGTRDAEAVATDIVKLARAGTIGVREQEGGPAVTDPARLEALLRALVADNLPKLVRVGLLLQ